MPDQQSSTVEASSMLTSKNGHYPGSGANNGDAREGLFLASEPPAQRADRARRRIFPKRNADLAASCFLVRLRTAQTDHEAILAEGDIGDLDYREFRPAKCAREADQNECTIT